MLTFPKLTTHVLEAAHEVVADGGAGQVRRVGAPPDVEEVIGAQHGVVLLGVAGGGQYTIHRNGHLERVKRAPKKRDRPRDRGR